MEIRWPKLDGDPRWEEKLDRAYLRAGKRLHARHTPIWGKRKQEAYAAEQKVLSHSYKAELARLNKINGPGDKMAKKGNGGIKPRQNDAVMDLAEGLGRFLGQAEAKWNSWRGEREQVVKSLTEIRDRASKLLAEVGGAVESGVQQARRGRPPGSKTQALVRAPKQDLVHVPKKKGGLTPEGRAAIAAAQKARWAAIRAKQKK